MEQRTKRNHMLINLVNDFESKIASDTVTYMDEKVFNQLISYYEQQYLLDKALEVVDYAVDQYPYRSDFLITKARLLILTSSFDEALDVLTTAETIAPFESELRILRVRALCGLNELNDAISILDDLKSSCTKSEMAEILLSESYVHERMKDYNCMFDVLSKALLEYDHEHYESLKRIWLSVELSRRYTDSITLHEKLVDLKPYSAQAWYNLGLTYSSISEYGKAIEAFEYAFIIDKDMEEAYMECADMCFQIKNYKKALSIYEEAKQYFGPDSDLLVLIAECQINLNSFLSAKASLFTALSLDPYNDEIYFYLGECYTKERNWPSALNAYSKAIAIENNREEYHGGIALAYIQIGNYELAAKHLKRASEILPEESKYWFQYACILIKNNQLNLALELLDEADEYTIDATLYYCKAAILTRLGEKKEAIEILDEALCDDFDAHHSLFEIDPQLKFDKDILSIINYYEAENI